VGPALAHKALPLRRPRRPPRSTADVGLVPRTGRSPPSMRCMLARTCPPQVAGNLPALYTVGRNMWDWSCIARVHASHVPSPKQSLPNWCGRCSYRCLQRPSWYTQYSHPFHLSLITTALRITPLIIRVKLMLPEVTITQKKFVLHSSESLQLTASAGAGRTSCSTHAGSVLRVELCSLHICLR
jgi:hypothetical protein